MSWLSKTTASGSYIGHKMIEDTDLDEEEQLKINELSAKCQANIANFKSQLPDGIPETLQKLEGFFMEPTIIFDAVYFRWFNFAPSVYDLPTDLTIIKNILTGIIELTQRDPCISSIETLDTEFLDKLDWLRKSLLRFLNRLAGHFGSTHRLPAPDSGFIPSKFEGLRRHVKQRILLGKESENSSNSELSTLQGRLVNAILFRKYRFQRARAHYRAVMDTSKVEGMSQEQSRFKSPIQAELVLDMDDIPKCPELTTNDPYRTCPCCFQSVPERHVQSPRRWREHVIKSLHLYTCIAEDCSDGNELFHTRTLLWMHIKIWHFKWECSFCDDSFSDSDDLRFHLHDEHDSRFNVFDDQIPEFNVCKLVLGLRSCPLCSFTAGEDSDELVTHVISHMYEFSFNFLPWTEPSDGAGEVIPDSRVDSEVVILNSNATPSSTVLVEESFPDKDGS